MKTHSSDAVSKGSSAVRRSAVVFAALASLAVLASPIHGALGAPAVPFINVDDPGRIAYQSQQSIAGGIVVFPKVPAGHRLVIQHVSAEVNFQSNINSLVQVLVAVGGHPGSSNFLAPFSLSVTYFDQLVQLYADVGDTPNVQFVADFGLTNVSSGFVTLTGYLLDCTAAPCATIAH